MKQELQYSSEYIWRQTTWQSNIHLYDLHCVCRCPGKPWDRTSIGCRSYSYAWNRNYNVYQSTFGYWNLDKAISSVVDQHCLCRWPGNHGSQNIHRHNNNTMYFKQQLQCLSEYMETSTQCLRMNQPWGEDIHRHNKDHIYKHETGTTMFINIQIGDHLCVCGWPGPHGARTSTGRVKI